MVVRLQRIFFVRHASQATFCFLDGPFSALDDTAAIAVDGPGSPLPLLADSCADPEVDIGTAWSGRDMTGCLPEMLDEGSIAKLGCAGLLASEAEVP